MKIKPLFGLIAGAILILSSCATSNEVNGGGIFQKRKYNKGFYCNRNTIVQNQMSLANEDFRSEDYITENNEVSSDSDVIADYSDSYTSERQMDIPSGSVAEKYKKQDNSFVHNPIHSFQKVSVSGAKVLNPVKKLAERTSGKINSKKHAAQMNTPGGEGDLGYLLGLVLIVVLIILIFTLLSQVLSDIAYFLGPLLATILLLVLIILLLRWLGII